jgi:HK97 gp10 family phage protein
MAEVTWEGIDTFTARLQKMAEGTAIETAMGTVGKNAKETMDSNTPVRTGKLKEGNTLEVKGLTFTLSNSTDYAIYVEMGTRFMHAEPFLAPAVESAIQEMPEILSKALLEE